MTDPELEPAPAWPLRRKLAVGAAFMAGLLIGGTGLAVAGALPGVHLGDDQQIETEAPDDAGDPAAKGGSVERSTEGCDGEYANHGAYVSAHSADEGSAGEAAHSECGKPMHDHGDHPGDKPDKADNPCRPPWAGGKPAWAGHDVDDRAAVKAEAHDSFTRPAECAEDDGDEDAEEIESEDSDEPTELEAPEQQSSTGAEG